MPHALQGGAKHTFWDWLEYNEDAQDTDKPSPQDKKKPSVFGACSQEDLPNYTCN